jgi:hypothetical protein
VLKVVEKIKGSLRGASPLFLYSPSPWEGEGDKGGEVVRNIALAIILR